MFSMEQIPPLSVVAMKVMKVDPDNPKSDAHLLENTIKPDKGISAELLKIANSALYGRSGRIKTLKDAIALLGLKRVKNLVIMLSTLNMSASLRKPVYQKYLQKLPVLTAIINLDLCKPLGLQDLIEEAFLLGILNKFGMSIIALNKPNHYHNLLDFAEKDNLSLLELETESYKADQYQVSEMAFKTWKMPDDITQAVMSGNCGPDEIDNIGDLARLTGLSGSLAKKMLEIPELPDDQKKTENIINYYNIAPETINQFDSEYFINIQEHPFYQQACTG